MRRIKEAAKLKSAIFVCIVLVFALGFSGSSVTGDKPSGNIEKPVLTIEKTVKSGETEVPVNTLIYWELEIEVSYTGRTRLSDVIVRDALPPEIELVNTTSPADTWGKGTTQIKWRIGTMMPGETATLTMWVATAKNPAGKQHFITPKEYELNHGAVVKGYHEATGKKISAGPTDSIVVYAAE